MEQPAATQCGRRPVPPGRLAPRWHALLIAAGLLAIVVVAHGGSLFDGLFFDDYWHRGNLENSGWSWHDMIEWTTFDLPGRLNHFWWQTQPLQWRYVRPAAMVEIRLEYLLTGGNPVGLHAFGLLWHWAAGLLVYRLARWGIGSAKWSFVAAALFLIHPHSVIGVSWIAARNAQISTVFFIAAVLAYAAASGPREASTLRRGMLAAALGLWGLALLSREATIVFPLVVLTLDAAYGGWKHLRRRLPVHALIWALAALYAAWRLIIFPQANAPALYFSAPHGLSYVPWAASKLLQMVFSLTFSTPMFLGAVTSNPAIRDAIPLHLIMSIGVLALAIWYAAGSRGVRGRWFWPVWVVAAFLPVVPVFLLPHFAYLSTAAMAVMLAILLSRLRGGRRTAAVAGLLVMTIGPSLLYRLGWRGIVRCEQVLYQDMTSGPRRIGPAAPSSSSTGRSSG